jgi:hypothetical protein
MRKKIKILFRTAIFSIAILIIYCCDPADNRLKVINNSNVDIYFFYTCDTSLNDLTIFKNGYYHNSKGDSTYTVSDQYVKSNAFLNIPMRGINAWQHYIRDCKSNRISIFFFTDSIVNKYSCEEIKNRKLYEKSVTYSLDDLRKNKWIINYP